MNSTDDFLIIEETPDLLILNKPHLWSTLPKIGDLKTAPLEALPASPNLGEALGHHRSEQRVIPEFGIVHRLDLGTSGLVVAAKSEPVYRLLREQWSTSAVTKIYRAIVSKPSEDLRDLHLPFEIRTAIGHDLKSAKRMRALNEEKDLRRIRSKPLNALSEIKSYRSVDPTHTELTIQISTGVRHQIRVHLASLGLPILGDLLYKGEPSSRLWLHSSEIELRIKTPAFTVCGRFSVPPPSDWPTFN